MWGFRSQNGISRALPLQKARTCSLVQSPVVAWLSYARTQA